MRDSVYARITSGRLFLSPPGSSGSGLFGIQSNHRRAKRTSYVDGRSSSAPRTQRAGQFQEGKRRPDFNLQQRGLSAEHLGWFKKGSVWAYGTTCHYMQMNRLRGYRASRDPDCSVLSSIQMVSRKCCTQQKELPRTNEFQLPAIRGETCRMHACVQICAQIFPKLYITS